MLQTFRVGKVSAQVPEIGAVRVTFEDDEDDDQVSDAFPVLMGTTKGSRVWDLPAVGSHVLCGFTSKEEGFVLGSFYDATNKPTDDAPDKRRVDFDDGASVVYDRTEHELTVTVPGDVTVESTGTVVVSAESVKLGSEGASTGVVCAGNPAHACWVVPLLGHPLGSLKVKSD